MRYLIFDTETGGVDPKNSSLLTAHFRILDENFTELNKLSLVVMPDDGVYKVTHGALKVNGIDIEAHAEVAIPYKAAKRKLDEFLGMNKSDKLIPIGHNVNFDINFIKEYISDDWDKNVSYRSLDTCTLIRFLKLANKLPEEVKTSLVGVSEYLGLDTSSAHDAEADVELTLKVLKSLLELLN